MVAQWCVPPHAVVDDSARCARQRGRAVSANQLATSARAWIYPSYGQAGKIRPHTKGFGDTKEPAQEGQEGWLGVDASRVADMQTSAQRRLLPCQCRLCWHRCPAYGPTAA